MKTKVGIFFSLCLGMISNSCFNLSNETLPYEEKIMVVGYLLDVDNFPDGEYDYSFIQTYKSIPVSSEQDNEPLLDIDFKLYAHDPISEINDTINYIYSDFVGIEGYYAKLKAKHNIEYRLEFTYDGQTYHSENLTLDQTDVEFSHSNLNSKSMSFSVSESDGVFNSYFVTLQDSTFSIFEAIRKFGFISKKYRFAQDKDIEISFTFDKKLNKQIKQRFFCVEVPDYLEEYFDHWNLLIDYTSDDFMVQLMGVPPENLSNYFKLKERDENPKHHIFGVFAPMNCNILIQP